MSEVDELFSTLPIEFLPRNRPPGGTNYLFAWNDDSNKDEWRADGYRWRQGGSNHLDNMTKKYFKIYTGPRQWSREFTRSAIFHHDHPKTVLVQYFGDESKADGFGTVGKKSARNLTRALPGGVKIKKSEAISVSAQKLFQELAAKADEPSAPQVSSAPKSGQSHFRLPKDALFDLHKFACGITFVRHITTFPDLTIVMWMDESVDILKDILKRTNVVQLLTYSTFNLAEFDVSVLTFQENEFLIAPTVPLAFMVHGKKSALSHEIFWQHMKEVCPELKKHVVVVAEQLDGVDTAIEASFPTLPQFLCWNNVVQGCKSWLSSHGVQSADKIVFYVDSVRSLLQSSTEAEYKDGIISFLSKWDSPFLEYYMKNVHTVAHKLGSWVLQQHGLTEVAGSRCEGLQCVLSQLEEWEGTTLDSAVLSLYLLAQSSVTQVLKGRTSSGDYQLIPELRQVYEQDETLIPSALSPGEIVQRIREGLVQLKGDEPVIASSLTLPKRNTTGTLQQVIEENEPFPLDSQLQVFIVDSLDPKIISNLKQES
ncbi:uncharacterized protein LOC131927710 isoform X2 [Physella acuta]|uniref:uncharacterized protein LOC131927710 isoform X2 n=1 Tax=Physella acuta TaxID=109671 RepID=UPI0027DB9828|nr:uncharacterized protein LOC131927710 isoform X2 [Physella acuta]